MAAEVRRAQVVATGKGPRIPSSVDSRWSILSAVFPLQQVREASRKARMTFDGKYTSTAFGDRDSATALAFHQRVLQLAKQFGLREGEKIYTKKNSERVIVH